MVEHSDESPLESLRNAADYAKLSVEQRIEFLRAQTPLYWAAFKALAVENAQADAMLRNAGYGHLCGSTGRRQRR